MPKIRNAALEVPCRCSPWDRRSAVACCLFSYLLPASTLRRHRGDRGKAQLPRRGPAHRRSRRSPTPKIHEILYHSTSCQHRFCEDFPSRALDRHDGSVAVSLVLLAAPKPIRTPTSRWPTREASAYEHCRKLSVSGQIIGCIAPARGKETAEACTLRHGIYNNSMFVQNSMLRCLQKPHHAC